MPLSIAQAVSLTCPQCNAPFNAEVWLIVDAGERPDLAARCLDGSIHVVACPNDHRGMLGAPLLYHDRAKKQLFLAYPPGMPETEIQNAGSQLTQQLGSQLLILPGNAYLDAPKAVPLELLGAAIEDKLDEAMAELQAHAEALRNDPTIGAAMRVVEEHPTLVQALLAWMGLDVWQDSKIFLEARPDLMTDDAQTVIGAMLDLARAQDDANAIEDLTVHRDLLRAARTEGVDAAYEKYIVEGANNFADPRMELEMRLAELNVQSQSDLERALAEHPELQTLMLHALQEDPLMQGLNALSGADSQADVLRVARAHPVLLSAEGMAALHEFVRNAREHGETETAKHLQERIATLEKIRASGPPEILKP